MTFFSDCNKIAEELASKKKRKRAAPDTRVSDASAGFDLLPDAAYVRLKVVASLYGISEPTVWRWIKSGHIPEPRKLGPNTTAWNVGMLRESLRTDK